VLVLAAPAAAEEGAVADRDGDGIADADDRCPDRAGLPPDGCPPRDRDGDGVVDRADRCPDEAGPTSNAGCPDTDRDGDGVVDRMDQCPDVAGHAEFAGCPVPDSDADGVADPEDRCPEEAEVWNGRTDGDGCPDGGPALLRVVADGVARLEAGFRGDRALDPAGRRAIAVAADLVRAMRAPAAVVEVVAEHGLSYGDSIQRARRRAVAVRAALAADLGWPEARIEVRALGPDGDPRVIVRYR
jgi:hypothetical protein